MENLQDRLEQIIFNFQGRSKECKPPSIIKLHPETKMKLIKDLNLNKHHGYVFLGSDWGKFYKGIPFQEDTKMSKNTFELK